MTVDIRKVTTDELQKKVVLDYVAGADTWDLIYSGGVQRTIEWFDKGIFVDLKPLIDEYGDPAVLQWDDITARSEEHTSELQSLMRISYAVFCLKKKKKNQYTN